MSEVSDIWAFHTGRSRLQRRLLEAQSHRERCWMPVLCFLIVHSEGPVLVDAGLGSRMLKRRRYWWGRMVSSVAGFTYAESMDCRSRIEQCGFDPTDVRHGLLTHMHLDHTGGILDLPQTTFYASQRELAYARSQRGVRSLRRGYLASDYQNAPNVKPLEWVPAEDLYPFDLHHDLFGDGAIRAFPTPGHTPGHLSVLVRTNGREVLVTGDASFTARHLESGVGFGLLPRRFAVDLRAAEHTLHQLRALTRRREGMLTLSSHDPDLGDDVADGPIQVLEML